jgi:hypothetical protein
VPFNVDRQNVVGPAGDLGGLFHLLDPHWSSLAIAIPKETKNALVFLEYD